ncbi:carboxypeptidase-like regulatory domain-containing protein [Bacteroides oleiciplenus]|uniref:Uncharacterized protein n=1 Tax=Bacteroides oleiciplenus YIT 12058 TaxID=742727 RepID=K9EC43_9BACE|nr:carboxypeptidase-like regulatory domain-containing protein [Bacteroides oleiciplenus]EKU88512.1 hypothetical protein HMPREF9447_04352 [Bacteroides oleiciplenus YIT 12058]
MKRLLLLLCMHIIFCLGYAYSQNTITGHVSDKSDQTPLPNVLIVMKSKTTSSIIRYTQTGTEGEFSMPIKETDYENCLLHLSLLGYKPQTVELKRNISKFKVEMEAAVTQLKEVTVKAQKIREQGDTLIYNVASFKDVQDKTIGDVLQKMPGIDVAKSGEITYNGTAINKFYIEGRDLLEGKYGIATNGISPDDVGSVEIIEDHQPIRVLQGVSLSSQAAVNLRLKEKAKAKWIVNALVAGGISEQPQSGLWMAELFLMRMKQRTQNITLYKSNNIGKNLEKEVNNYTAKENEIADYIQISGLRTPNLEEKRTLFSRSHLFSSSNLWAVKQDWECRAQVNYLNQRNTGQTSALTTYYLPEGDRLITEDQQSVEHNHTLTAQVSIEGNKETFYLQNSLKADIQWNDVELATTGSLANQQHASLPNRKISNNFKLIKRWGNHLITFNSVNQWNTLPQNLTVIRNGTSKQTTDEHSFFSHEQVTYGFHFQGITLSLEGGAKAQFRSLNSQLTGVPDSLGANTQKWTTNYIQLYVTPKLEYKYSRVELILESPIRYYRYLFSHQIKNENDWMASPSLRIKWNISPYLYAILRGQITPKECDLHSLYNGLILTDYRTLTKGMDFYSTSESKSLSTSLNFKQPLLGLFANIMVMRSWNSQDYLSGQEFIGDYILRTYRKTPSRSDTWTVFGTMSYNIDFLKGTAGLNVIFRKNNRTMLSEGIPTNYTQENYNVTGRLNGRIGTVLNWQYRLNYGQNHLKIDDQFQQRLNQWEHALSLTASFGKRWNLQGTGEYYRNEIAKKQFKDMILADGKLSYNLNSRLELSATVSNLFNRKNYAYTIYNDLSSAGYTRMIRGREFFVSIYLKK